MQLTLKRVAAAVIALVMSLTVIIIGISKPTGEASANRIYSDDYDEFLYELGRRESNNNYQVRSRSYYGRWQLGKYALQEAGLMTSGGAWTALAKSYGVTSVATFLQSEDCQDYAVLQCSRRTWYYLKNFGMEKYIGQTYQGVKITQAGLIAGGHLAGAGALASAIKSGSTTRDGNGVSATVYMKALGGYDIAATIASDNTLIGKTAGAATGGNESDIKSVTVKTEVVTTTAPANVTTTATAATTTKALIGGNVLGDDQLSQVKTFGDVDGNGEVNSQDATLTLIYFAEVNVGNDESFEEFIEDYIGGDSGDDGSDSDEGNEVESTTLAQTTEALEDTTTAKTLNDGAEAVNAETQSTVTQVTTTVPETTEPTETTTQIIAPDNPMLGDVNMDGKIDATDATMMLICYAMTLVGLVQ